MSDNRYITDGGPLAAVNTNAIIWGIALIAAGSVISFAGVAVGATALVSVGRRWVLAQPEPPAAAVKRKIGQASAATAAGARAWQSSTAEQSSARKRARR
jgi:hypothetical protein